MEIERGAEAAYSTGEAWVETCDKYGEVVLPSPAYSAISETGKSVCRIIAKAVLEAAAEVIEVEFVSYGDAIMVCTTNYKLQTTGT